MLKVSLEKGIASINSNAASKLNGILKICKLNNFSEDKIFVMGNSENDLEIISHFKYSAATIESHSKQLKKQAQYIINIDHLPFFIN